LTLFELGSGERSGRRGVGEDHCQGQLCHSAATGKIYSPPSRIK
jgi:hypothetical protein